MVAHTEKGGISKELPREEGVVNPYDREESMAPTIVHHHMRPSVSRGKVSPKAST